MVQGKQGGAQPGLSGPGEVAGDRSLGYLDEGPDGPNSQGQVGITAHRLLRLVAGNTLGMGKAVGLQVTLCRREGRMPITGSVGRTGPSRAACQFQGRKASSLRPQLPVIYGGHNVSTCTKPVFRN